MSQPISVQDKVRNKKLDGYIVEYSIEYNLNPAISEGYIRLLYPDKPRHPRQKYLLTVKGNLLYNELTKDDKDVEE